MNLTKLELPVWVTAEGALIVGGLLWAVIGAFVPAMATLVVPPIPFPGLPQQEFQIAPAHMIIAGFIPAGLKFVQNGKSMFVNTKPADAPPAEGEKDA